MADSDQETRWRASFETVGYDAVRRGHNLFEEPKRQFAFRWLREQEIAREDRNEAAHWYLKWTFRAAVAALIVGIVSVTVAIIGLTWH